MYKHFFPFVLLLMCLVGCSKSEEPRDPTPPPTPVEPQQPTPQVEHKYMFLTDEQVALIKQVVPKDHLWASYHGAIMSYADGLMTKDYLTYKLDAAGKRLLSVSREFFKRVTSLAYAYRMTGYSTYLSRALSEMRVISGFQDWHPSHFLDVAEMSAGMAIAYNWLYKDMNDKDRTTFSTAIRKFALEPSDLNSYNKSFLAKVNNWNQVCNGGVTLGALAIDETASSATTMKYVNRAVESIKLAMNEYKPDGAYPEGYSYYQYGTFYNLLLIQALKDLKGTDYGLSAMPGFLQSGYATMCMVLNDLAPFNYSDCGSSRASLDPCMFWMAANSGDNSPMWLMGNILSKSSKPSLGTWGVFGILWGASLGFDNVSKPSSNFFVTREATNPIAVMRTGWDYNSGLSMAVKSGSVNVNHGHMDIGSFVFAEGSTRWAIDLGSQDYSSLESKGVDLWNMKQTSQRWQVYRYNNYAHNTLTFNDALQQVSGKTTFSETADDAAWMYVKTDLSSIYADQVSAVVRTVGIKDGKYGVVKDEIKATDKQAVVRWTMMTKATPIVIDSKSIMLMQDSKKLLVKVVSDVATTAIARDAIPTHDYDAQNDGVSVLTFETTIASGGQLVFEVNLIPQQ